MSATLPTRPTDRTTLTFSFTATQSEDKNYNVVVGGQSGSAASTADTYTLTPGMRLVYLLTMSKPIRLPEFWPFYGKELRLKQAIRLDNDLHVTLTQSSQYGSEAVLPTTGSQLYTLINTLSYNVLDNVKINFSLEQDLLNDPYANDAINQPAGYYELKLSLGMEATF
jgi:hypothetical protein